MSHPHTHSPGPVADASVRTARATDAPAIGLVQATVFRETYADVLPEAVLDQLEGPRFASVWRQSLEHPPTPAHRALVACAGDQVVGLAALGPADPGEAGLPEGAGELLVLGVHPDARRQGHGSRLLNATADTLRAHDHRAVVAWVPAGDEATRAFLGTGGLQPDGAWRERVVGPAGETLREIRVVADL
ncbi:GNAT family N-acetyltransferase [Ornithinimicrobium sediminis]|uniref:GNAT family N-acetyltransferase n=1 Tax=Ornithinimicrobium sediminis TaxID=2904603 RepID=UPI001E5A787F|nr:GNAT family N-acetyltransferase [Ornithinimicrobium sediminis]